MASKTNKNPLILILISVVVIFIAAIIYKNFQVDNSETVTVPKINTVKSSNSKEKKQYDFKDTAEIPLVSEPEVYKYAHLSKEEREKKVSKNLNKYTLYRTPEQVMEVIYELKGLGKDEEAEEYIDFLIKRFPDYEMQ